MDFSNIENYLKNNLNKFRYDHTLRVVAMGETLGRKFNYDIDKIKISCYLHDAGKNISKSKILEIVKNEGYNLCEKEILNINIFHGVASMVIARDEFNIHDEEILNSIRYHVTGREDMTLLDKIVFLSDYFEIGRDYNIVHESRDAAINDLDLDKALLISFKSTIKYLLDKDKFIHEDTLRARNFLVK